MSVVEKAIKKCALAGKKLLVSCSGGVDSMVLLHALASCGFKPEVVHVNYHLRGQESDADQQLVEAAAKKLGLECSVFHCPETVVKGPGINLQAAARDFRRAIYSDFLSKSPENRVLLGHHADDQVETFFLQLFRGSGSVGLGGMFIENNGIIRPFLGLLRSDLLGYALANGIQWREDASNSSLNYVRNLFRNRLIPALEAENPRLRESVLLLMKIFRENRLQLEQTIAPLVKNWKSGQQLLVESWNGLGEDAKVLFLHQCALPLWVNGRMQELISGDGSRKLELENGMLVARDHCIRLVAYEPKPVWDYKIIEVEILPQQFSKDRLYLDGDKIEGKELLLRHYRIGDRIKSLGVGGSQLVSDILKDAKIPVWKRSSIPLLEIGGEIAWLPGLKVAETFLATRDSGKIVEITICRSAD